MKSIIPLPHISSERLYGRSHFQLKSHLLGSWNEIMLWISTWIYILGWLPVSTETNFLKDWFLRQKKKKSSWRWRESNDAWVKSEETFTNIQQQWKTGLWDVTREETRLYWCTVEELLPREEESFCKAALLNFSELPNKHTFKVIALLKCIKKASLESSPEALIV